MIETDEHQLFRKTLRDLFEREIEPHVDEWESARSFPAHELFPKLATVGLFGLEQVTKRLAKQLMLVCFDHPRTLPLAISAPSAGVPLHCASVTERLVAVQHDAGVCTLVLNSPANRNALSARLLDELAGALRAATTDDDVRVVVLTGSGTVFCSGADLS